MVSNQQKICDFCGLWLFISKNPTSWQTRNTLQESWLWHCQPKLKHKASNRKILASETLRLSLNTVLIHQSCNWFFEFIVIVYWFLFSAASVAVIGWWVVYLRAHMDANCLKQWKALTNCFKMSPLANEINSDSWPPQTRAIKVFPFKKERGEISCLRHPACVCNTVQDSERKAGIITGTPMCRDWEEGLLLWQWHKNWVPQGKQI